MKLSTKSKYGLKAVCFLASNDIEYITLKDLAIFIDAPMPFLEKLLGVLRKNNIVETIRGSKGGYKLSKDCKVITVGEVVGALEGKLKVAECSRSMCNNLKCPNKNIFNKIYTEIDNTLNKISIFELLGEKND